MLDNFPVSFRNDRLRKHRRKILFEREKSLLPAMQVFVEAKQAMERIQKETEPLNEEHTKTVHVLNDAVAKYNVVRQEHQAVKVSILAKKDQIRLEKDSTKSDVLKEELTALRESRAGIKQRREPLHETYLDAHRKYYTQRAAVNDKNREFAQQLAIFEERSTPTERRQFVMKCPSDECRGFLSTAYKCGTCSKHTCSDCLVVLGEDKNVEHTCKKEEVESAKAIKAETRACPKCGARIFKIDGCDQMWCTMDGCGTAFSWDTGQIVTGRVHNPHYYEWLRRNGGALGAPREAGDIPCGGMPNYYQLHSVFRVSGLYTIERGTATLTVKTTTFEISEIHRNCQEIIDYQLANHPSQMPRNLNKLNDVKYLMNEISQDEWQRQLELAEARFNRKKEIGFILNMFCTAAADMFREAIIQMTPAHGIVASVSFAETCRGWLASVFIPNIEALRVFTNESLQTLGKKQNMAVPQIGAEFKWMPARILHKGRIITADVIKETAVADIQDENLPSLST